MTNKEKYHALCKEELSIPIFSQPFWLDAVCGAQNWDVLLFEKGKDIVALMPYFIKKVYGISYITQPLFTQTLGPWIKYPEKINPEKRLNYEKEIMFALIEQLEKISVVFYQQMFSYKITNWLPFFWKGYKQTTCYTYRINDISDVNEVLKNFSKGKKDNIRQALTKELLIDFDLSARRFYDFHCLALRRKGLTISYPFELFENIYNTVYNNKNGQIIYAKDKKGNLHSALLVIWDLESAYLLINIIDPDFGDSRSSSLLFLEIIRFLSNKTKSFDFEGSMIENVEKSYNKFGTVQIPYFKIWKIYTKNPLLKMFIKSRLNN